MYAMIMFTLNFGNMISFQLGGLAMRFFNITDKNFENLWMLILLANVTMLIPLPFIYFVDFNVASVQAELYVATPIVNALNFIAKRTKGNLTVSS